MPDFRNDLTGRRATWYGTGAVDPTCLAAVAELSDEALLVLDQKGLLRESTGRTGIVWGGDDRPEPGCDFRQMLEPADRAMFDALVRAPLGDQDGRIYFGRLMLHCPDGRIRPMEAKIRNRLDEPGVDAVIVALRDVEQQIDTARDLADREAVLHSVLDTVQSSDHVLFIPADLEAWDPRQRGLLLRELDGLPAERVQLWSAHPADVEGHGFCQQEGIFRRPAEAPDLNAARVEFQDLSERLTAEAEAEAEAALAHEAESAEEEKLESIASEPEPADQFSMRNLIDEWKQEQVSDAPVVAEPEPEEIEQAPEVEHTDAGQLPEWATTPSLNMMVEEEGESAPVIESVADVKQDDEEVEPEQLSVLRQPTLDHRPRHPARGTRRRAPSARSLGVSAIATAAATSEEVPELAPAEPPDAGISQASLTAAGDRATHVGVLEGPADPDIFSVSGLDAAVRGARGLEAALQEPHFPNSSEVHVGSWNAAAITAGDARDSEQRPDMDENPAARHVAARGQQTRSLTQFLAGKEIEALWYDRIKTVRMTGISGGILDRLRELSDRGHPVKELVNRIEADMDEGIALLSEYERRAEQATRLLANLGELESKGVIDPDSGVRMRTVIISLEDLDRLDKLFEDLQE